MTQSAATIVTKLPANTAISGIWKIAMQHSSRKAIGQRVTSITLWRLIPLIRQRSGALRCGFLGKGRAREKGEGSYQRRMKRLKTQSRPTTVANERTNTALEDVNNSPMAVNISVVLRHSTIKPVTGIT